MPQIRFDEDAGFSQWFEHCFSIVAGEVDLQSKDDYLTANIAWMRAGSPIFRVGFVPAQHPAAERANLVNRHPLMQAYLDAKVLETLAGSQVTAKFWTVAKQLSPATPGAPDYFQRWAYQQRMRNFLNDAQAYHREQVQELQDSLRVRQLFSTYDRTLTINLALNSGGASGTRRDAESRS